MVKRILLLLPVIIFVAAQGFSQSRKTEIQEIKGEILDITSGFSFAYSALSVIKTNKDTAYFRFPPEYGQTIVSNFKKGSEIEIRAKVVVNTPPKIKKITAIYHFQDEMLAIKLNGQWLEFQRKTPTGPIEAKVFLEKLVTDEVYRGDDKDAILIEGNVVGFTFPVFLRKNDLQNIKIGDRVSFMGLELLKGEGYAYPRWNPSAVYTYVPLLKIRGKAKAYLQKQNYVYIGMTFTTAGEEQRVSFPSDMARQIKDFVERYDEVTVYHSSFKVKGQLDPPELHALAVQGDTLVVKQFGFYGGADVKHDHLDAEIEGKISLVNKSDKGKMMSVIVGNDCYIEVDQVIEKNLGTYLKKGAVIKVQGEERIKREGEIYSKDYRIITPRKITVNEKEFVLNTLPY